MVGLRILSLAMGQPDPYSSQWTRILSISRGLRNKRNEVILKSFLRCRSLRNFACDQEVSDCHIVPYMGVDVFHKSLELLHESKPDIVYANTYVPAFLYALNKPRRVPLVFDMHGFVADEKKMIANKKGLLWTSRHILPYLLMERLAVNSSDKIFCVSHHMMKYLSQIRKVPKEKMDYVTNGVDLAHFRPLKDDRVSRLREKLGLKGKLTFGYIGNFQKWQGVQEFIRAASLTEDDQLRFLIIGGDDAWVRGNVVKLKKLSRSQLPFYYSLCDVLVLPRPCHTATEVAAPTKFAEYAAMGRPILSTEVGDAATFVKNYQCGIVVRDTEVNNLKKGFQAFKELSTREIWRMGRNARAMAEKEFDWNKIVTKIDLALTKLGGR